MSDHKRTSHVTSWIKLPTQSCHLKKKKSEILFRLYNGPLRPIHINFVLGDKNHMILHYSVWSCERRWNVFWQNRYSRMRERRRDILSSHFQKEVSLINSSSKNNYYHYLLLLTLMLFQSHMLLFFSNKKEGI